MEEFHTQDLLLCLEWLEEYESQKKLGIDVHPIIHNSHHYSIEKQYGVPHSTLDHCFSKLFPFCDAFSDALITFGTFEEHIMASIA